MFDGENCIRCNQHFKFEDLTYRSDGYGLCHECNVKLDPKREQVRACPHDGTKMNKSIVHGKLLVDNCPSCGGIWLDGDELEIMREMLVQQGRAQASAIPFFFPFWIGAV